ncbi:MAG: hypothetical protein ABIJ96_04030 [Elusimicrobiota bacterium]
MPFTQVSDILGRTQKYHHQLAVYYRKIRRTTDRELVRLLADDLSKRQRFLGRQLKLFRKPVKDSWMQYDPSYDLERVINELDPRKKQELEDLFDAGIELNRRLIKYYCRVAEIAPTTEMKELFKALERYQLEGQRALANSVQQVQ